MTLWPGYEATDIAAASPAEQFEYLEKCQPFADSRKHSPGLHVRFPQDLPVLPETLQVQPHGLPGRALADGEPVRGPQEGLQERKL